MHEHDLEPFCMTTNKYRQLNAMEYVYKIDISELPPIVGPREDYKASV